MIDNSKTIKDISNAIKGGWIDVFNVKKYAKILSSENAKQGNKANKSSEMMDLFSEIESEIENLSEYDSEKQMQLLDLLLILDMENDALESIVWSGAEFMEMKKPGFIQENLKRVGVGVFCSLLSSSLKYGLIGGKGCEIDNIFGKVNKNKDEIMERMGLQILLTAERGDKKLIEKLYNIIPQTVKQCARENMTSFEKEIEKSNNAFDQNESAEILRLSNQYREVLAGIKIKTGNTLYNYLEEKDKIRYINLVDKFPELNTDPLIKAEMSKVKLENEITPKNRVVRKKKI